LLIVVGAIFVIKQSVDYYNQGPDGIAEDGATVMYTLFFVLFYRVNMAHVLAGIVESGRQFYPDGTMAQFWVEMLPIGTAKVNVFDGNEFGRSMGIAAQEDFATGVAVTNMGDFYLNWAFAGIVLGMFLHGLLYKVLVNSCSGRRPTSIMVYGLLFPIILHGVESPISVLYATVLKMAAMCLFVDFMVRQKGRVPTVGGVAVPSGT
jgi:hypothetical protein